VEARSDSGETRSFGVTARLDNQTDVRYVEEGGVLPLVLRQMMASG